MKRVLTRRQRDVFDFIAEFIKKNGYSPAFDEIGAGVGLSSLATVSKHVENLKRKGWVEMDYCRKRSLEIVKTRTGRDFLKRAKLHMRQAGDAPAVEVIEALL